MLETGTWGAALFPVGGPERVGPIHGAPLFGADVPAERPRLAINMVASVDGRVTADGRSAVGLGSPADQHLLRRLRAEADAVLVGAGALRAERFSPRVPAALSHERVARGQPPQPIGVVVSGSGQVDPHHPYFTTATPDWPRLVYTVAAGARALARPGVEVQVMEPGGPLDLALVLAHLRARGVRRMVCEGGPTLNASLVEAGLADELFLTLAPTLLGGRSPLTLLSGEVIRRRLELRSVYERAGELFLRYRVLPERGV